MKHWIRNLLILVILVGVAWFVAGWYSRRSVSTDSFRTAEIARGDIVATIGATGTLQPEEVINVGAQVAGRITEFGKDEQGKTIDYRSEVDEGMVLARIDPALYESDVASAEAQVASAKAGIDRAVADLGQMKARFNQAERDWQRAQKLGPSDALAQVDYDAYESSFEAAKATVSVGDAAVEQARRAVAQAQATLDRAKRNLGYCTIISPVKGVIIDRRVNIGQTVVASLNAPSLFLLAKDLKRMQVWVAVNEADIGSIKAGQPVSFTVDAFPGRTFQGEVSKVRLNAAMTQNVVTYTVEVLTDNSSGILLPYLTANVRFEVNRRDDVLMVPNAALRWYPQESQVEPAVRDAFAKASSESEPSERRSRSTTQPGEERQDRSGTLWVRDGQFVKPIHVRAGLTDGVNTEITGDEVREGLEIIVGEVSPDSASSAASPTNPFAPRMGSGNRQGRGPRL